MNEFIAFIHDQVERSSSLLHVNIIRLNGVVESEIRDFKLRLVVIFCVVLWRKDLGDELTNQHPQSLFANRLVTLDLLLLNGLGWLRPNTAVGIRGQIPISGISFRLIGERNNNCPPPPLFFCRTQFAALSLRYTRSPWPHLLQKPNGVLSQFASVGRWRGLKDFVNLPGV